MDVKELERLLRKCWSKETSADPDGWTPENPAWGQCAVTSLVVQDFFGGDLMRGSLENVKNFEFMKSHYWNRIPNRKRIDLSRSQFPKATYREIPRGEPRDRTYPLSHEPTRRRFTILRLAIENELRPNPLFSDPIYQKCFEVAQTSSCKKMRFGCLIAHDKLTVEASNKTIEPLQHLCEPECIRSRIKSRTESMIGACGHAEEWALKEARKRDFPLDQCSLYIAGFQIDNTPWIKQRPEHTCIRCATQMFMAQIGKIYVPVIDRWEAINPEEALKTAISYALPD